MEVKGADGPMTNSLSSVLLRTSVGQLYLALPYSQISAYGGGGRGDLGSEDNEAILGSYLAGNAVEAA